MVVTGSRQSAIEARVRALDAVMPVLALVMLSCCASRSAHASGSPQPETGTVAQPTAASADDQRAPASTREADAEPPPNDRPRPWRTEAAAEGSPPSPASAEHDVRSDAATDAPKPPDHPDPCARANRADDMIVDDTRQVLEEQTCKAALWLDSLFGKVGDADAARRTRGFLEVSNVYSQFEGFDMRGRLHIEFDLPVAKNQLSAFVGRENDEDFVRGRTDASELRATFPTLSEQNQWLAGLGYSLPDTSNTQTNFRIGVRGLGPPTAFVQGMLRYTMYADDDDVAYVKTTPFWNTHDRAGVTQSFDYSHVLSKHYLARWYSVGTISQRSQGVNWRNSAILYHNLEHKRGLAYEAFIRGETDEPEPLYEYGGRVLFRHPFLGERLFAEWAAGYSFPRTDPHQPRNGSASIGVSIDLPFGDPRD